MPHHIWGEANYGARPRVLDDIRGRAASAGGHGFLDSADVVGSADVRGGEGFLDRPEVYLLGVWSWWQDFRFRHDFRFRFWWSFHSRWSFHGRWSFLDWWRLFRGWRLSGDGLNWWRLSFDNRFDNRFDGWCNWCNYSDPDGDILGKYYKN